MNTTAPAVGLSRFDGQRWVAWHGIRTMNETSPTPTSTPTGAPRPRRPYDAAFKQAALAHCQRHGGGLTRTAQELGINHWPLRDWVQAEACRQQPPAPSRTLAESEAENARLRAELIRVTAQREILKKSLGIRSHS